MSNSTHTQKEIEAGESAEGCIPRADTAADTDAIISEQEKKENQCIGIENLTKAVHRLKELLEWVNYMPESDNQSIRQDSYWYNSTSSCRRQSRPHENLPR